METRKRLVESTRELLWDRGYDGTSPKQIQRRAAAGQGSMYHHFRDKADLARAAIDATAQELRADVERRFAAPGRASERITAYLRRSRDVLRGCPIGGLTQDPEIVADPRLRRPVDETLDWLQERLAELVAEAQADGDLRGELDPGATAAAIVATLQGGYVLARAAQDPSRFDRAIAGITTLLGARPDAAGTDGTAQMRPPADPYGRSRRPRPHNPGNAL